MLPNAPLPQLPARRPDSHKGTYGRALVVAGSRGMAGAAALTAMAAIRGGAGLVTVATAESCFDTVAAFDPCLMTVSLPDDQRGRIALAARAPLRELVVKADCVALGPGLGRSLELTALVKWLYESVEAPLVVDADGLNALSERLETLAPPAGPRVLTPHPGEFRRLSSDFSTQAAAQFARRMSAVLVLKGSRTLTTDGTRQRVERAGNPGMATAGSGDVLTGLIAALVCQRLSPFEAASLGVHLHGKAGNAAAARCGQVCMTSRDLIASLPEAFRSQ